MTLDRRLLIIIVAVFGMITVDAWAYGRLTASKRDARDTSEAVRQDRELAHRITQLQKAPAIAVTQQVEAKEFAKQIERSASAAQIPANAVVRIAPAAPRRIGESPYLEHPTQLLLRQVTLAQVFSFLHALSDGGSPLEARSIRLSAAREDPTGTQWTVELTLSYKLYSPIPAKAGGRSGT